MEYDPQVLPTIDPGILDYLRPFPTLCVLTCIILLLSTFDVPNVCGCLSCLPFLNDQNSHKATFSSCASWPPFFGVPTNYPSLPPTRCPAPLAGFDDTLSHHFHGTPRSRHSVQPQSRVLSSHANGTPSTSKPRRGGEEERERERARPLPGLPANVCHRFGVKISIAHLTVEKTSICRWPSYHLEWKSSACSSLMNSFNSIWLTWNAEKLSVGG